MDGYNLFIIVCLGLHGIKPDKTETEGNIED